MKYFEFKNWFILNGFHIKDVNCAFYKVNIDDLIVLVEGKLLNDSYKNSNAVERIYWYNPKKNTRISETSWLNEISFESALKILSSSSQEKILFNLDTFLTYRRSSEYVH